MDYTCLYPAYLRGQAYLAQGQGRAAQAEFQKYLDHRGLVWNCPLASLKTATSRRNMDGEDLFQRESQEGGTWTAFLRDCALRRKRADFGGYRSLPTVCSPSWVQEEGIFCMATFEKHIFICGNQRPVGHPRGCCDPAGQAALQKLFKQKLAERGLKGRVRANQSGCLDQCEHGPNIVIYPDAVWYGGVTAADVDEIIDRHIIGGEPVERLRLRDSCINTAICEHKPRRG